MRLSLRTMVLCAAILLAVPSTQAATCTWTGATNTDWNTPGNWVACGGVTPQPGDSVVIADQANDPILATVVTVTTLDLGATGILTVNGPGSLTIAQQYTQAGGSLSGTGSVTISGGVGSVWSGGSISGSAPFTLAATTAMAISGAAVKSLDGRAFMVNGTINWTGAGSINIGTGASFQVGGTGMFHIQNDSAIALSGGAASFTVNGILRKSVATGATTFGNFAFSNAATGTLDLLTGKLVLTNGGSTAGAVSLAAGTMLEVTASQLFFTGGGAWAGTGVLAIMGTGTLNVSASTLQLANLDLGGTGTISGPNNVVVGSTMNWTGGSNAGTGVTQIDVPAVLNISGAAGKTINGRVIANFGTTNWSGTGSITQQNNGRFNNSSLFIATNDATYVSGGGVIIPFNNTGTFRKTTAAGTTLFNNVPFDNNSGTIDMQTGRLEINGGGTSSGTPTFTLAAGTSLRYSGGTYNLNAGTFSGLGVVELFGGTLTIPNPLTIPHFQMVSGILNGGGTLTIPSGGTFGWDGGIQGTNPGPVGTTNIAAGATMNMSGAGVRTLSNRILTNNGTINAANTGTWTLIGGAQVNNNNLFEATSGFAINYGGGAQPVINNAATWRKAGGATQLDINTVDVTNSGTMETTAGVLRLNIGTGTSTGTFDAEVAGTSIVFGTAGNWAFNAGTALTGAGLVIVNGATLTLGANVAAARLELDGGMIVGTGNLNVSSLFRFKTGTHSGVATTTVGAAGALEFTTNLAKSIIQRTIVSQGSGLWSGGNITLDQGATISNQGTFNATSDNIINYGGVAPASSFANTATGVFTKTGGFGFTSFATNIPVTNAGTIESQIGTIHFVDTFTQSAGALSLQGGNINSSGTLTLNGGALRGDGIVGADVACQCTMQPGNAGATGSLDLAGLLSLSGPSDVQIDIGPTATTYDRITANNVITLGGALNTTFIGGFTPSPGDVFPIMESPSGISGSFGTTNIGGLGIRLDPPGSPTRVALFTAPATVDLSLSVTDEDPVPTSFNTFWQFSGCNNSGLAATNVSVSITAPAGFTITNVSPSIGTCNIDTPTTVSCNVGTLDVSTCVFIDVDVTTPATGGMYTINGSISSTESEATPGDNNVAEPLEVVAPLTLVVNTTTDAPDANVGDDICATASNQCSLRAAVQEANAHPYLDKITVPSGTYTLNLVGAGESIALTGDLDILDDVEITGTSALNTIIDGNGTDRVFEVFQSGFKLEKVTIRNGNATGSGGGGILVTGGQVDLQNVELRDNTADSGGGISFEPNLLIEFNAPFVALIASHNLQRVAFVNNSATAGSGGGLYIESQGVSLTNATFAQNSASARAGALGVFSSGSADLTNVTISQSSTGIGGALYAGIAGSTVTIRNSIVADSVTGTNCSTLSGTISSNGYNLDTDGTCLFAGPGDLSSTVANLGTLATHGGQTRVYSLLETSPAIDAGNNGSCATIDQRGVARPVDGDGDATADCDMGAFEFVPGADLAVIKTGPLSVVAGTTVSYSISVTNNGPSSAISTNLTDTPGAGLTFASATGPCTGGFPCNLGTLVNGQNVTITANYNLAPSATGTASNTAGASSATTDPTPGNNSSTTNATILTSADLAIVKSGPPAATPGNTVTYNISVTNNGPSNADSVSVSDTPGAGLTFASATAPCAGGFPCALGTLIPGQAVNFTATFNIAPGATISVTNTASVSSSTPDPTGTNDSSMVTTPLGPSADLSIAKTGPPSATPGQTVTYSITVLNNGPSTATGVSVADTPGAGLTFASATAPCTGGFPCSLGSLNATQSITFNATFNVDAAATGSATNTATVSATTADSNNTNDSSMATTPLTPSADVAIVKSGPPSATPGQNVTYNISVTNNGPSNAAGVTVSDTPGPGLTFVSATAPCTGGFPCNLGTLTPGQNVAFTATFSIAAVATGSVTNTASVSSSTADPTSGNNTSAPTTALAANADLAIFKTGPASATPGQSATYNFSVTNAGPSSAVGVVVNDTPGAGLTFASATAPCAGGFPCNLGTLAPGQNVAFSATFNIAPSATGSVTNTASVTSSTADGTTGNNTSAPTTALTPNADVAIVKTGPASVAAGAPVTYTISVTNNGPSNATGVSVSDTASAGLTFASATAPCTGGFPCALGTLTPGQNVTFTATFNVAPSASGTVTNTAAVTATTTDGVPTNDSSSVNSTVLVSGADIALAIADAPDPVAAGANVTYTATITNNGPGAATSPAASFNVTGGTLVSAGGGMTCTTTATTASCSGPATLAAGGVLTVSVVVQAGAGPTVTLSGAATSSTTDGNGANNNAVQTTTVGVTSDVSIAKDGPTSARPNTTLIYTITVTNAGPAAATGVVVNDPTPARLSFLFTTGACNTPFPCNLGTIPAGQTRVINAHYEVISGGGPITNTATVSSTSTDSNSANNSASETTPITCPPSPSDLIPAPNATATASGVLRWSHQNGNRYRVFLGEAGIGCTTNTPFRTVTARSVEYSGLQAGVEYEWRVEAETEGCPTTTSACQRFLVVRGCSETPPTLLTPANNQVVASPITFSWTSTGIVGTTYTVMASVNGGPFTEVGHTEALTINGSLPDGAATWFVVATAPGCPRLESARGNFNTCNLPPAPLASVIGQVTSTLGYNVQWLGIDGSLYELQRADNVDFNNAMTITTSVPVATFGGIAPAGQPVAWWFRVRQKTPCSAVFGPYSIPVRIVIVPLPPPNQPNPNITVPAGTTQEIVQPFFIPGVPGPGPVTYSAVTNKPYVTVRPASGPLPPEGVIVELVWNPANLPNGTFTASVLVTVNTPNNSRVQTNGTTVKSSAVSISLVTPVTPSAISSPPDNALVIPSAGHLDSFNAHWQSDVRVTNTGGDRLRYQLSFTPAGADPVSGVKQTIIDVDPGATTALDDIVRTWYGYGDLGDSANGTLEIRPLDSGQSTDPNSRVTVASSRTYNSTANGTLGQYIPAIPFASFIGRAGNDAFAQVLSLQQVAQNAFFRTNVGVVEAGGHAASVNVSVFNAAGTRLAEVPIELKAGEQKQLNSFLATLGITDLADGRIEVQVTGGDGRVTAYASVVDAGTTDPLLVSGVPLRGVPAASRYVLPGVADINTGIASWRTDMRVFNSGTSDQPVTLTFHPQDDSAPKSAQLTVNAGEVKSLDNVLQSLFDLPNNGGSVHVTTPGGTNLVVTGRTYNRTEEGTYGQFVPAVTLGEAVGLGQRTLEIPQVEDSSRYRTNIGFAEVSGQDVEIEVSVTLPDTRLTPRFNMTLPANSFRQIPVISALGLGDAYNARISVRVVNGGGRVTAYGSVIDQITQDPTYVPAQ